MPLNWYLEKEKMELLKKKVKLVIRIELKVYNDQVI